MAINLVRKVGVMINIRAYADTETEPNLLHRFGLRCTRLGCWIKSSTLPANPDGSGAPRVDINQSMGPNASVREEMEDE